MKEQVCLIGVPDEFAGEVTSVADRALADVRSALAFNEKISIVIFQSQPAFVIPEIGQTGRAIGREGLEVLIDFDRPFEAGELVSTIHHETAHLVRGRAVGYRWPLGEAIVSEGIACFVEKQLQPDRHVVYAEPLPEPERYLREAEPMFDAEDFDNAKWFFGGTDAPRWLGYRLGYAIIAAYMRAHPASIANLIRMPAREIWDESSLS